MNWNWSCSPETLFRRFLEHYDLEIWWITLKNNRAPLLSNIKLCASFHHHMWIQTGVTVQKRQSWVLTSVTLTFDLWPWPFAWTSLLSLVITPVNFMMIRWWEHSQKGVTDGRMDGKYHSLSCLVAAKNNRAPLLSSSSFVQHFIAISEFKLELQSKNAKFGSKSTIFSKCHLEIWLMTLKNK